MWLVNVTFPPTDEGVGVVMGTCGGTCMVQSNRRRKDLAMEAPGGAGRGVDTGEGARPSR